jgi:hypothetical protein
MFFYEAVWNGEGKDTQSPAPRYWLEERRRKAGRTLDEIADSTKISVGPQGD